MKIQAKLDLWQSLSGLLLALFLLTHLLLVSSILISKEAMGFITHMMEASFLSESGEGYPIIVSIIALFIFILVFIHAVLAMRKLPSNWNQHKKLQKHLKLMPHNDTKSWRLQAITGVIIMFLVPAHLFIMFTEPETIGPVDSSIRVYQQGFWLLYLPLLIAAELHSTIGLYRLCIKWGWFMGDTSNVIKRRNKIAALKIIASAVFLLIGLITLYTYYQIGSQLS